ncbi:carbohydrate-binding protein [Chelativorans sp. Marseille-P2723]|uniref:carbohydrate-binding protein n=1 Tax=Chelativorans sp. Marseille-P2723 TaxID=2709133 RepID=UPI001AEDE770|nr:carbohydrate-binding protein [Chelativorans sp. Marseille-P2723]
MSKVTVNNTIHPVSVFSTGTQGPIGLNWQEEWSPGVSYAMRDAVLHAGSSYRCTMPHAAFAESEPGKGTNWATFWTLLAAQGARGERGPQGEVGPAGERGPQGEKGHTGDAYESYGVSIFRSEGIVPGGYYADRRANAASVQAYLYAEIIDGDPGSAVDLYLEVGGSMVLGPIMVTQGNPQAISSLDVSVAEGDTVSFVVVSITGGVVRDLFVKSYGAMT